MITDRIPRNKAARPPADRLLGPPREHFTLGEGDDFSPPRPVIRSRLRGGEEKAIEMQVNDVR